MIESQYQAAEAQVVDGIEHLDVALDHYLQRLLEDLRLFVPYDAAAAWLGHDDRPSLRVVVPADASLPSAASARHSIFQMTAQAACIDDLHSYPGAGGGALRCWLGVPLVLHGQRRGWIELLSVQPHRFSDLDLQRADTLVRHAAFGLTQLETMVRTQQAGRARAALLLGIEQALLAPTIDAALRRMLQAIVEAGSAHSATLVVPVEMAYALNLHHSQTSAPLERDVDDTHLVTVVARWPELTNEIRAGMVMDSSLLHENDVLVPCVTDDEPLCWIGLHYEQRPPLGVFDVEAGRAISALMIALIVWLRDQTQREHQAQQSVRMLVQHTHQMRSSSIADLMAGLAHELNNPLSAMIGITALLQRDSTLHDAVREDLAVIATEAYRVSEFVKRLSNFGQASGGTKAPLGLNDVVIDAVAVCQGLAQQRNVALDVKLPNDGPVVLGNRAHLQQVCLDLLSNALEAIETSDAPRVTIEVCCEGRWAQVKISDNGYGVPDDLKERIFTPGFTTKTSGGTRRGLGMGLPMAQDIIRNHWGTISVTSRVWQGSCFTVQLPLI